MMDRDRFPVDPWRLVMHYGTEYVVGRDHKADAARTFRLSRILGEVKAVGEQNSYEIPAEVPLSGLEQGAIAQEPRVVELAPA